jgi:hypothetical protein
MRALVPARSLVLVGAILLGGCGYRSAYVPPPDGRARMVWASGKLVAQMPPSGVQLCYREPGPGGTAPATPPIWGWPGAPPNRPPGGRGVVWVPYVGPPSPGRPSGYVSESRSGGESSGKGEAVGVAVAILVVMPLVTAGLALDPPGIDSKVAGAIDDVNWYNDSMRRAAVPCAAVGVR